ncbi:hypothetical protein I7I53_10183 [Histoplasma capsulatum var. duboisii H88]|uniref:Uncharacterized protein n=1 Tax=Ajellomyces capsulatus (strain H88) TaxID=544711 RepID=A0A8A1LBC8_AJEC8|nr:hypothetical protein I7I53_10183 [Histoplasma capsulatum var. duboisii H88]
MLTLSISFYGQANKEPRCENKVFRISLLNLMKFHASPASFDCSLCFLTLVGSPPQKLETIVTCHSLSVN